MRKRNIFIVILLLAVFFSWCSFAFFTSYYFLIPIEFMNSYQIPCASIEIQGNSYQVEFDLGTKMALSLDKEVLEKIEKNPCGVSRRLDFRGNKYETPLYLISNVKVGNFSLKKVKTREESLNFTTKNSILIETKESSNAGRLGRDFFAGKNIFMDFKQHILIVCSKLKDLKRRGYEIDSLIPIPFKNSLDGIVLEVEMDIGKRKFVMDTGTTASAIRLENLKRASIKQQKGMSVIETTKFAMGGVDFGLKMLYILDISREFHEMDGLLGMDFLKEHVVYLDFSKEIAYIGRSNTTSY